MITDDGMPLVAEMLRADRIVQRDMVAIEQTLADEDSLMPSALQRFERQSMALVYGRRVRHQMLARQIIIGRSTPDLPADVDVLAEAAGMDGGLRLAGRVSRRQLIIKFKHDGNFYARNIGHAFVVVNGRPLAFGQRRRLKRHALIEIGSHFRFLFEVNLPLVETVLSQLNRARQRLSKAGAGARSAGDDDFVG